MKILNWFKSKFIQQKCKIESIPTEIRLTKKIDMSLGQLTSDIEEPEYKSIREFTESEIIDFIYKQKFYYQLYKEMGLSDPQRITILRGQKEPFILKQNSKPGDLDLILFDPQKAENAIAMEVKCVKFKTEANQSVTTNKEKLISEGITQVNKYLKLGFHKTYLLVILLDESWEQAKPNYIFKESGLENAPKLVNPKILKNLDRNIGLLYMGVRQITSQSVLLNTRVDIRTIQDAVEMDQNERITEIIKRLKQK